MALENKKEQGYKTIITIYSADGVYNEEVLRAIQSEMDHDRAEFVSIWNIG